MLLTLISPVFFFSFFLSVAIPSIVLEVVNSHRHRSLPELGIFFSVPVWDSGTRGISNLIGCHFNSRKMTKYLGIKIIRNMKI